MWKTTTHNAKPSETSVLAQNSKKTVPALAKEQDLAEAGSNALTTGI